MKLIAAAFGDHSQVSGLRVFRAVARGVYAEFRDTLDGRKQVFRRATITDQLYRSAIESERRRRRQLAGEGQVAARVLVHARGERRGDDGAGSIGGTEVEG